MKRKIVAIMVVCLFLSVALSHSVPNGYAIDSPRLYGCTRQRVQIVRHYLGRSTIAANGNGGLPKHQYATSTCNINRTLIFSDPIQSYHNLACK